MEDIERTQETTDLGKSLEAKREIFRDKVLKLSEKLKDFKELPNLIDVVICEQQVTLEYYHSVLGILAELNKTYKSEYARYYNFYKTASEIRYSSDQAINAQINSQLGDLLYKIELMDNFAKYIHETLNSLKDIKYAIQNRIRIEEILLGK